MGLYKISASLAVAVAATAAFYYITTPKKSHPKYFMPTYYQARRLFRNNCRKKGLELHSLPITANDTADLGLTIDVAIYRGSNEKVMIHLSGTHGVEGYAGSAIQAKVLESLDFNPNGPTIVFVHALNPYGMAFNRRWNENGVDLNRNGLSEAEFQEKISLGAPKSYQRLFKLLNPPAKLNWDFFWPKTLYYLAVYGFNSIKATVVTGNYTYPNSLFFGGQELQQSHVLLSQFLKKHLNPDIVKELVFIDIHTGLGPKGFDTLMVDEVGAAVFDVKVFGEKYQNRVISDSSRDGSALSGYDEVSGGNGGFYGSLFPNLKKSMILVQEFGTVNGIAVFKALRADNAAFHHDPDMFAKTSQDVCDVFYLRNDCGWKEDVLERGETVFRQTLSLLK
ncbi:hypothetical protein HDV02_001874 [Globomyces sp. JEL0801]|nr:hypothetical protein HDV02_001874 [Globomyces sp. JEL0801]